MENYLYLSADFSQMITRRNLSKIFLTGATGFLGSYVLKELVKNNFKVVALVRKTGKPAKMPKSVEAVYGDLLDIESLKSSMSGADMIINAAASTPNREKISGRYLANTLGVKNLIEAANHNGINRIIHISSISVNFGINGKYVSTKREGEKIVINSGLDYILFRPSSIYGAGSPDFKKIIRLYKKMPFAIVLGSGGNNIQPVYVEDVAKVVCSAINKNTAWNKLYDLGGPNPISFSESIEHICAALDVKMPKLHIPRFMLAAIAKLLEITAPQLKVNPERINIMLQDRVVDIAPAKMYLGYSPLSFKEGLIRSIGKNV